MTAPPGSVAIARPRAIGLPVAALLVGVVGIGTTLGVMSGWNLPVPWIVPDEIIFSELAKSIASGSAPALRETTSYGYGVVYPLLIAPAWLVFQTPESAYAAAKVINAILFALAAVPTFFLARRFVRPGLALVAAALSVVLPSAVYVGVVMPESAYYGIFIGIVLLIVRALEQPSWQRQLVVFAAVGVGVATEPRSVVLLPGYAAIVGTAALLEARAGGHSLRSGLWQFRLTWAITALGLVGLALAPTLALGAYSEALSQLDLVHVPRQVLYNLGSLDLLVGVAPAAASALVVAAGLRRTARPHERMFAAVSVPLVVTSILLVSSFRLVDVHNERHVLTERNIFYLAPLLLIGLTMWFDGVRRPRRILLLAGLLAAAVLPALIPLRDLGFNARFQAPSAVLWIELNASSTVMIALLLLFGAGLASLLLLPKRWLAFAPFVLMLVFVLSTGVARSSIQLASEWTERQGGSGRGWVDRAVGDEQRVAVIWREAEPRGPVEAGTGVPLRAEHRILYLAEFFNRSVATVYNVGRMPPYPLPYVPARVRPDGTVETTDGEPIRAEFVFVECSSVVRGRLVASDPTSRARLIRTRGPIRLAPQAGSCGPRPAPGG